MSAPSTRRSTRLQSRTSGAPATPVTPSVPSKKKGKGPAVPKNLPTLQTNQSSAYGAQGRADLGEALKAPAAGVTFAEAFDSARADGQNADQSSGAAAPAAVSGEDAQNVTQAVNDTQAVAQGAGNSANQSKSFGVVREGGVTHGAEFAPSTLILVWRWIKRYYQAAFVFGLLFLLFYVFVHLGRAFKVPTTKFGDFDLLGRSHDIFEDFFLGYKTWDHMRVDVDDPKLNLYRIKNLEAIADKHKLVNERHGLILKDVSKRLPQITAFTLDKETGQYVINPHLWKVVDAKIREEWSGKGSAGSANLWKSFLEDNDAKLRELIATDAENSSNVAVANAIADGTVITKDHVMTLIEKHVNTQFQKLEKSIRDDFDDIVKDVLATVQNQIDEKVKNLVPDVESRVEEKIKNLVPEVKDAIEKLEHLATMEVLQNKVNYLSAGLGAIINPYLTSPTYRKHRPQTWKDLLITVPSREARPPIEMLMDWNEMSDCWCAAKGPKGRSQAGMIMPYRVYPKSITIEHIKKGATLDITAAPKWVELWVDAESTGARGQIEDLKTMAASESNLQECSSDPPSSTHSCVGRWMYDVDRYNNIQNFPIDVDFARHKLPVRQLAVRVTENYGQGFTCMYRVRLHGEIAQKIYPQIE